MHLLREIKLRSPGAALLIKIPADKIARFLICQGHKNGVIKGLELFQLWRTDRPLYLSLRLLRDIRQLDFNLPKKSVFRVILRDCLQHFGDSFCVRILGGDDLFYFSLDLSDLSEPGIISTN